LPGERQEVSPETAISLNEIGMLDVLYTLRGSYLHHYPV
jgi:hypothetical protein